MIARIWVPEETPGVVWYYKKVLSADKDGREWVKEFTVRMDVGGSLHFEVEEHKDGYEGDKGELSFKEFLNELVGVSS